MELLLRYVMNTAESYTMLQLAAFFLDHRTMDTSHLRGVANSGFLPWLLIPRNSFIITEDPRGLYAEIRIGAQGSSSNNQPPVINLAAGNTVQNTFNSESTRGSHPGSVQSSVEIAPQQGLHNQETRADVYRNAAKQRAVDISCVSEESCSDILHGSANAKSTSNSKSG